MTGGTSEIELTIIGSIDEWNLGLGQNENITSIDLGVTTTAASWTVGVRDALNDEKPPGTNGQMVEWTGSAYPEEYTILSNPIQVKSGSGNFVSLSDSDQIIQSESSAGIFNYDIGVRQDIQYGDARLTNGNNYRIVITFTGSTL